MDEPLIAVLVFIGFVSLVDVFCIYASIRIVGEKELGAHFFLPLFALFLWTQAKLLLYFS